MSTAGTDRAGVARVVVGACGEDDRSRLVARAMLLSGHEVVFIGGDQSVEQVARTVVSEDASTVLLDAAADDLDRLGECLRHLGLGHVEVAAVHVPDDDAAGVTNPTPRRGV